MLAQASGEWEQFLPFGIIVFGVLLVFCVVVLACRLWKRNLFNFDSKSCEALVSYWKSDGAPRPNLPKHYTNINGEYLYRKNEFWISTGQIIVAIVITCTMTVLLVMGKLQAETAMSIFGVIAGFAGAKTAASSRPSDSDDKP